MAFYLLDYTTIWPCAQNNRNVDRNMKVEINYVDERDDEEARRGAGSFRGMMVDGKLVLCAPFSLLQKR